MLDLLVTTWRSCGFACQAAVQQHLWTCREIHTNKMRKKYWGKIMHKTTLLLQQVHSTLQHLKHNSNTYRSIQNENMKWWTYLWILVGVAVLLARLRFINICGHVERCTQNKWGKKYFEPILCIVAHYCFHQCIQHDSI